MDEESTCSTVTGTEVSDTAMSKPPCEDAEDTVTGCGDEATLGTPSDDGTVKISSELGTENAML